MHWHAGGFDRSAKPPYPLSGLTKSSPGDLQTLLLHLEATQSEHLNWRELLKAIAKKYKGKDASLSLHSWLLARAEAAARQAGGITEVVPAQVMADDDDDVLVDVQQQRTAVPGAAGPAAGAAVSGVLLVFVAGRHSLLSFGLRKLDSHIMGHMQMRLFHSHRWTKRC